MPAGEKENVAINRTHPLYYSIGTDLDLLRCFASGTTVAKQVPFRTLGADVGAAAPFIFSVIPFDQIPIDLGHCTKPRQFARLACPFERTGVHLCKGEPFKAFA